VSRAGWVSSLLLNAAPAACAACVEGARPLSKNNYKIDAAKGILEEALSMLG
jgi:hypothetical protein